MTSGFNIHAIRTQFPALSRHDSEGRPFAYFDGPGGSQVPARVADAVRNYLVHSNANTHGAFATSRETDDVIEGARAAMADLLNAHSADEIVFGANMTTLTFHLGRSIGRTIRPGDEIIVTQLDHDANVAPWRALEERGATIRVWDFDPSTCRLHLDDLGRLLSPRTRLVAVGYASNAVGTINDVEAVSRMAHEAGALVFVDAVHYAPHGLIDVRSIGCDFLACSAYKFFGPHVGVLWGRQDRLEELSPYKVRPSSDAVPSRFETGTLNHEGLAGVTAAVNYLAELGGARHASRREALVASMEAIHSWEGDLARHLARSLRAVPALRVYPALTDEALEHRAPTFAIRLEGLSPAEVARRLAEESVFVWDGNFYACGVTERLGVEASGGFVRIGLLHYNTHDEIDRLVAGLRAIHHESVAGARA